MPQSHTCDCAMCITNGKENAFQTFGIILQVLGDFCENDSLLQPHHEPEIAMCCIVNRGRLEQSCAAKKMQEKDETNAPCERERTNKLVQSRPD